MAAGLYAPRELKWHTNEQIQLPGSEMWNQLINSISEVDIRM